MDMYNSKPKQSSRPLVLFVSAVAAVGLLWFLLRPTVSVPVVKKVRGRFVVEHETCGYL